MAAAILTVGMMLSSGAASAVGEVMMSSPRSPTVEVERRLVLMGTLARVVVTAPSRDQALSTSVTVERLLQETESALSTWKPGTVLGRLNHSPIGRGVSLPEQVDAELTRALRCTEVTRGTFNPTVGALVAAYDLRGAGRQPDDNEVAEALQRTGWSGLSIQDTTWTRVRDVIFEEGGFGKGAALDRVMDALRTLEERRVLVDLGGQLLLFDSRSSSEPWPVDVAHPEDRSQTVLRLNIPHGSIATSGNSERASEGQRGVSGHLLDPRTGKPAPNFGSLTVWAPSALEADCLATGLFVAGPEAALDLAASHSDIEVLVLQRSPEGWMVQASDGIRQRIDWLSPALKFDPNAFTASRWLSRRSWIEGICAASSSSILSPARAIQRPTGGSLESFQLHQAGIFFHPFRT